MLHAVIDIGTVTARLFIAEMRDGQPQEILRRSEFANLGVGVDETGYLKPEAIERTVCLVAQYLGEIEKLRQQDQDQEVKLTAVATSASRDAHNAQDLLDQLADFGVDLQVIAGEQEAAYCFAGASLGYTDENLLVSDIGGGSTELIAGQANRPPEYVHSFQIGCRRITERFLHTDPPALEELAKARAWCEEQFAGYFERLDQEGFNIDQFVAVAGTATSAASVSKRMEVYDRKQVHNTVITRDVLDEVAEQLASLTLEQRRQVTGLNPGRADVIVGGMVILQAVLGLTGKDSFTVSESDLLMGVVSTEA